MFLFRKIGRGPRRSKRSRSSAARLVIIAIALTVGVLVPAAPVLAQTAPVRPPLSLMTSPLPLNVITKPGQTVTADLRVKNNGTRPEVLKVELLKFGASGSTGRPQLMERDPQDQYFDWISFSESNFTADPNVWKTIKMTIKAPKEAAFGYYFAVLFSRAVPDRPTGNQSAVEGGVASLVLLNVDAPGARREAKVAELVATQKVYEFLPAKFSVKLRNSGNVHVAPVGTIFIKRGDAQVAAIDFNDERGNILPATDRIFDLNWNDGFPSYVEKGTGKDATRSLEWDFGKIEKLRFGRYTATLVAVYDDGQRDVPIEAVVSFWVIPWRILGVILLIVLLIGGGIWGILRLIWKNVRRQIAAPPAAEGPDPNSLAAATKKRPKPAKAAKTAENTPQNSPVQPPAKKAVKKKVTKATTDKAPSAEPAVPETPTTPIVTAVPSIEPAPVAEPASAVAPEPPAPLSIEDVIVWPDAAPPKPAAPQKTKPAKKPAAKKAAKKAVTAKAPTKKPVKTAAKRATRKTVKKPKQEPKA